MPELWFAILAFILITYIVLDGRNFGVGAVLYFVAKTPAERRQAIEAIGPLWTWHEVWLVAFGGVLFAAFPRVLATAFSGYYLALFMVLWALILRGLSMEFGGHLEHPLWRTFWNVTLAFSSMLLALLLGVALGNTLRGVPLDSSGEFHLAFFTDFGVKGKVGLLDWYSLSIGLGALVALAAHGATYLAVKTDGPVAQRSQSAARALWGIAGLLMVIILIETLAVRGDLFADSAHRPLLWIAVACALFGAAALITGLRPGFQKRACLGSHILIAAALAAGAVARFPVILFSTLDASHSMTIYNSAANHGTLVSALLWWPAALVLSIAYAAFYSYKRKGASYGESK